MIIGLPKETKDNEFRVGMSPGTVHTLTNQGHFVRVQTGAGIGSAFSDDDYRSAGADIVSNADEAWSAQLVVKVKEPTEPRCAPTWNEYCANDQISLKDQLSDIETIAHAR